MTALHASNNNRSATVLDLFKLATTEYGMPSWVRRDHDNVYDNEERAMACMFMRYNGECIGHCHNAFPSNTESVDKDIDLDHGDSVDNGAEASESDHESEGFDDGDDDETDHDNCADSSDDEADGIDLDTLF